MRFNLSEVNDLIRTRRTIYPEQFSDRKVHREQIVQLLDNARWAPTHRLTQPWRFAVFMEAGLKKLGDWQSATYKEITPSEDFSQAKFDKLKDRPLKASAVIVVCMKRDEDKRVPEVEEVAAVAAAVQNIYLTSNAWGLGCYWSTGGLTYTQELKDYLGLEEEDQCMGFLYIGYPDIDWPKETPRKPVEYFTEWVED